MENDSEITFWRTGSAKIWAWDRIKVNLNKGKNTIQINPEGFVILDHVNVIKK